METIRGQRFKSMHIKIAVSVSAQVAREKFLVANTLKTLYVELKSIGRRGRGRG